VCLYIYICIYIYIYIYMYMCVCVGVSVCLCEMNPLPTVIKLLQVLEPSSIPVQGWSAAMRLPDEH